MLLIVPATLLVGAPQTAEAHHGGAHVPCSDPRGCPDLISDGSTMNPFVHTRTFSASDCNVREGSTEAGTRKLLRFTFTTPNVGRGDLVVGVPETHPEWFEWGACHGHWHFRSYAEYRLWTPTEFARWDALRDADPHKPADDVLAENPDLQYVRGAKQGFCVIDLRYHGGGPLPFYNPPKYLLCDFQGISAGWADEYYYGLDGQFVDVTGVPAGTYVLEEEVNAHRLYVESDYSNNRAWVTVTL